MNVSKNGPVAPSARNQVVAGAIAPADSCPAVHSGCKPAPLPIASARPTPTRSQALSHVPSRPSSYEREVEVISVRTAAGPRRLGLAVDRVAPASCQQEREEGAAVHEGELAVALAREAGVV